MKTCFVCQAAKPLQDFYRHSRMADGHLNKCKDCTKTQNAQHRASNLEKCQEYDRDRYHTDSVRRAASNASSKRSRIRNPEKYKARTAVGNAIRDGRLIRQGCEVCGAFAEAHHEDYQEPLKVKWLCKIHHEATHHLDV